MYKQNYLNNYKKKYFIQIIVLFFFHVFSFQFISAQIINDELDKYLDEYISVKDIPSISAGAALNGKILWIGARGYSDIENSVQANINTLYRIASISKTITAVAIMQLAEKGKINIDEDVRRYLPYFPAKRWKFTIRQLLNHTAGIRNYRENEFDSKEYYGNIREAVSVIMKDSLMFKPGTKYLYTTLGYNLLAAIIERISGVSYEEYLKKNIFEPSEMKSTYTDIQRAILPHRARGYEKNDFRQIQNAPLADLSIKYPGGGILSTSEDILKFGISLLSGKLISSSTLDSMLIQTKLKNGYTLTYGLGVVIGVDEKGKKYFYHTGGGTGFSSFLNIYPEDSLVTVHLINIRDRNLENPAAAIAKIIRSVEYVQPKISLADKMFNIYIDSGLDSALAEYNLLKDSTEKYIVSHDELELFGYDLISINKTIDAIKFFKIFISLNKDLPSAYIGLADAYNRDGNKGLALKNYRAALKLSPSNSYASSMVKKLSKNN